MFYYCILSDNEFLTILHKQQFVQKIEIDFGTRVTRNGGRKYIVYHGEIGLSHFCFNLEFLLLWQSLILITLQEFEDYFRRITAMAWLSKDILKIQVRSKKLNLRNFPCHKSPLAAYNFVNIQHPISLFSGQAFCPKASFCRHTQ